MLTRQEYCDYVSFDGSSDINFYDYIEYSQWNGIEKTSYVTTTTGNYIVSEFGGKYRVVVWVWRKTSIGMDSPFILAQSNDMRIPSSASLHITITQSDADEFIEGLYEFTGSSTDIGDYLVLYALNEPGKRT